MQDMKLGALAEALNWVDNRFGPIRDLSGFLLIPPEPAWWVYTSYLARTPPGSWFNAFPAGAAGTSIDPAEALRRALGEAVERYSGLSSVAEGVMIAPSENELDYLFPTCAPEEQCPASFKGLAPDVALTHLPARRLADDREVFAPAGYVSLSFWPQPPEPVTTLPISTGLAFQADLISAIWGGLCEVAERDAMMMMWWLRHGLAEIDCNDLQMPAILADRIERLRRVGLTPRLFDMTTDFRVPSVFCIITGERYPFLVAGASCRADPRAACAKALDEAVSARVTLMGQPPVGEPPSLESFEWVRMLEHHTAVYAIPHLRSALDFLLNQQRRAVSFDEFAWQPWWEAPTSMEDLASLAARQETDGLTVLWTDVTAPEAEKIGRVVKVIVPEMLPLSQDHNARWLATPRLLRAAGIAKATVSAFNPFPHPFA